MSNAATVIIVNYKVAELTIDSLRSLEKEITSLEGVGVVVVDNDSQDGSYDTLSSTVQNEGWSSWVKVVASDKNGGFAYGNNVGIRYAQECGWDAEYYWFLNPDTTVYPHALEELVDFAEANPKVGICGSSIVNADGSPWPICFRFPSILSEFERGVRLGIMTKLLSRWKVPREMGQENSVVDWLPGASFLIRSKVFDDIGLMDDGYFLYYEETDFCYNAKKAGWECWYVPKSKIMHVAGASTGVVDQKTQHKPLPSYLFDSRYRYFKKNHGFLYALITDAFWITGYSLWALRRTLFRSPNDDPKNMLKDSIKHSALIRLFSGKA